MTSGAAAEWGPPALRPGVELAPGYTVLEHLNRGRALDVYDVWSAERNCLCVAKVLRPDRADDGKPRHRLVREGRLLQRLTHPHIVRLYELIREPEPVVVLEALTGATLSYVIDAQRRRMRLTELSFLGLHLCSAVGYLHGENILHLDLKPSNIISEGGVAKVIDLSLARRPGRGPKGVGTRQYLPPEQARGDLLSEAADVWGIGGVLFRAATGQRPFELGDDGVKYPQLERRADRIRSHRRLPAPLAALLDACLEPIPDDRPSIGELADAFEAQVDEGASD